MILRQNNSTVGKKLQLRRGLLQRLAVPDPYVLETHGGRGAIWKKLYSNFPTGAALEKDPANAEFLARQRPDWAVYEVHSERVLGAGLLRWKEVDFLDVDPYGEPWPVLEAFFSAEHGRRFADRMALAVNDGLRQNARIKGSWKIGSMKEEVRKYGNDNIRPHYLQICKDKLGRIVGKVGYTVEHWAGYYTGNFDDMTHYGAVLVRSASAAEPDLDRGGAPLAATP
jgi:hypothetical protein